MTSSPSARQRAAVRRTITGGVLVLLGLLLWLGYGLAARAESHSYADGRPPPRYVQLHAGERYVIGIPGGRPALVRTGIAPDTLRCAAAGSGGGSAVELQLTVESDSTKATTQIASFTAPFAGRAHVTCTGLARVYIDNTSGDPSGLLLVAAITLLAVGVPILLSAARGLGTPTAPAGQAQRPAGSTQPPNARSST